MRLVAASRVDRATMVSKPAREGVNQVLSAMRKTRRDLAAAQHSTAQHSREADDKAKAMLAVTSLFSTGVLCPTARDLLVSTLPSLPTSPATCMCLWRGPAATTSHACVRPQGTIRLSSGTYLSTYLTYLGTWCLYMLYLACQHSTHQVCVLGSHHFDSLFSSPLLYLFRMMSTMTCSFRLILITASYIIEFLFIKS